MTTADALARIMESMFWADDRVLRMLECTVGEAYVSARRYYHHVLAAERVWLLRLRGENTVAREIWPSLSDDEARALAAENRDAYRRYLGSLSESDLEQRVEYANQSNRRFRTAISDILIHVGMHGAYHRGQVARAVREAGGDPVNTDFITYVREIDEAEPHERGHAHRASMPGGTR